MKIATLRELSEPTTHTKTTGSVEEQSPCHSLNWPESLIKLTCPKPDLLNKLGFHYVFS